MSVVLAVRCLGMDVWGDCTST